MKFVLFHVIRHHVSCKIQISSLKYSERLACLLAEYRLYTLHVLSYEIALLHVI